MVAILTSVWTTGRDSVSMSEPVVVSMPANASCPMVTDCLPGGNAMRMHWVSHTGSGDLYLMVRPDCQRHAECGAWFVERTDRGMTTRLNIDGRFRVLSNGRPVPDVQSWRPVSDSEFEVTLYSWNAGVFQKVERRSVFIVDGEECGTALECFQKAQTAHQKQNTDRALRILEKVHNVSFI